MASSSLDLLISRLLIKDEIDSIGLFTNEKDIQHLLHQVEIKFKELKLMKKINEIIFLNPYQNILNYNYLL